MEMVRYGDWLQEQIREARHKRAEAKRMKIEQVHQVSWFRWWQCNNFQESHVNQGIIIS